MNTTQDIRTMNTNETPVDTKRILIVEDERTLAMGIRDALIHAGFDAEVAYDGDSGLEMASSGHFDLVVLDLMLPGRNGLELLKGLRQHDHKIRVLMLTALSEESHILQCFEAGADDYMSKPFSPRELVARIGAQFRRATGEPDAAPIALDLPDGISVDLARLEVKRGEEILLLTPRGGDILEYLIKHHDKVVTREDLLRDEAAWFDLRVRIEKADPPPPEAQPALPPIQSPVEAGPKHLAWKVGK